MHPPPCIQETGASAIMLTRNWVISTPCNQEKWASEYCVQEQRAFAVLCARIEGICRPIYKNRGHMPSRYKKQRASAVHKE